MSELSSNPSTIAPKVDAIGIGIHLPFSAVHLLLCTSWGLPLPFLRQKGAAFLGC